MLRAQGALILTICFCCTQEGTVFNSSYIFTTIQGRGGNMEVEKEKGSDEQKGEDSKKLLRRLREQLHSSNGSIRRQAGFNLSWLQEDGLEVLKGSLFGDSPITTKTAAAYGLRKVHGRMKKMALDIFKQGREHQQGSVREVCTKALILLGEIKPEKTPAKKAAAGKLRIREIPARAKPRRRISVRNTAGPSRSGEALRRDESPRRTQPRNQRPMRK